MRYGETCVGGGSIILNKKPSVLEKINDVDCDLISIYGAVKYGPDKLIDFLSNIPHCQESFDKAKECGFNWAPADEFVLRRMSRSGMMKDYAFSERLRGGKPENLNAWENSIKAIRPIHNRLKDVDIYNEDLLDFINRTVDFLYIDPPFLPSTRAAKSVYRCEMSYAQHEEMLKAIHDDKRKILLAGYDSELYKDYLELKGWTRLSKELTNHSSQSKKKKTKMLSLWKNYS